MFLFRCCLRVDCSCHCQSEPETEPSRLSQTSSDCLQQYEKQIQCRLLPQPVATSTTKHFVDYSGCSYADTSRSLLVGSTQSVDYEEVLLLSVPSGGQKDESIYAVVNDHVICKPPSSSGFINDKFSPDASCSNNNLMQLEFSDDVRSKEKGDEEIESVKSSDVSSAMSSSSSTEDEISSEVRYTADIRRFRTTTQTSSQTHGEECSCDGCRSANHHHSGVKCSCKLCRDFCNQMQSIATKTDVIATADDNPPNVQYRLLSGRVHDFESIPLMRPTERSDMTESAGFDSWNTEHTFQEVSLSHDDPAPVTPLVIGDDNGQFSSDDELHYVFHKFIDRPFIDVSTDDRFRLDVVPTEVLPSQSGAVEECVSARSADDLEVAFFMVGNITPDTLSTVIPEGSHVPASEPVSTEYHTNITTAECTIPSCSPVTESLTYCSDANLSDVWNASEQYSVNVLSINRETDTFTVGFETCLWNASSEDPCELEEVSGALQIESSEMQTGLCEDSDLIDFEDENQQIYLESDGSKAQKDVIELSDSSSFFSELPATDNGRVSDVSYSDLETIDVSTATRGDSVSVVQEYAPTEHVVVIGQSWETVTPECMIERPVSNADVKASSLSDDDIRFGHVDQYAAAYVMPYIHSIIADAVQKIADDAGSVSMGICNITSEDICSELPKQIFIANEQLFSDDNWLLAVDDECDRERDSLLSSAEVDVESHGAADVVRTADINILTTDSDADGSNSEIICMTVTEPQQVVPRVEDYLISYDVQLELSVDDDVNPSRGQMSMPSSYPIVADKITDDGDSDVMLVDLVQPLEHVVSKDEQDTIVAGELNVSQETQLSDFTDTGDAVTFSPADIVEDFFVQYVLPVDSVVCSREATGPAAAAAAGTSRKHQEDVVSPSELDEDSDDLTEVTAQHVVDIVISDALMEADLDTDAEVDTASAVRGVQDVDVVECLGHDRQRDDEQEIKMEAAAETTICVEVNDDRAKSDADLNVDLRADKTLSPPVSGSDTQLVVRARSSCLLQASSEPHRKKSVHFADMHGLQLETVQHYVQSPQRDESATSLEFLSKLSAAAAERRARWTEHHPSRMGSWLCNSSVFLLACFELPGSQADLMERVRHRRVALESCSFDDLALAITGVVRVANIAFHKSISVRYTVNRWATHTDIDGEYILRSNDGPTDRFSFTIILPSRKQFAVGNEAEFAICYMAGDDLSFKFWDNNDGRNYVVRCCSKTESVENVDNSKNDNDYSE